MSSKRCTSHVARHTSRITRHTSHVTHHTSHITHHASHVTQHKSKITQHTSLVTHLKSHITHHTSHVTRHTQNFSRHTQEIQADCYLTFHLPVAATARRQDGIADANCVESTTCEGRVLLLTTEAMDYWLRVDRASSCTHAFYWPAALWPVVIGPHLYNVVFGVRIAHGTDVALTTWATIAAAIAWPK